jgi:hypothetical protein
MMTPSTRGLKALLYCTASAGPNNSRHPPTHRLKFGDMIVARRERLLGSSLLREPLAERRY